MFVYANQRKSECEFGPFLFVSACALQNIDQTLTLFP